LSSATKALEGMGGLLSAGHWGTAAIVWAFTYDTGGGRPRKSVQKWTLLNISDFTSLGIRGLSSRTSIIKYRQAWEHAIDEGWVEPAEPGKRCVLPEQPFGGPATAALIVASGENEWYTPSEYIDAARSVMGSIDLDAASGNAFADLRVALRRHFHP
jgi:hypothetical protein